MKKLVWVLAVVAGCKTMGDAPPQVSEWLRFDRQATSILFDVTINGVPAKASLDTGAVGSVLDGAFAEKAGIGKAGHVMVIGAFGRKRLDTAKTFTIAFVGQNGPEGSVSVQDAVLSDQSLGCDVLLGLQFFRRLVLQIDYPNARFRFMTRSASTIEQHANTNVRLDLDSGRLLVEVEVNGRREWALFDTGASFGLYLSRRTAEEGGWLRHAKPVGEVQATSVTREAELEMMLLEKLKLGPYELADIPMAVQNRRDARKTPADTKLGSRLVLADEAEPALLGHDILRHFVVTLDLERALLHVYAGALDADEPSSP
jgi:predicted aspartyl protease